MTTRNQLEEIFAGKKPHEIAVIICGATGFRTTRIEELTEAEAERIMRAYSPPQPSRKEREYDAELIRTWRSNILTVATRIGIKSPQNFDSFNHWMKAKSKYKKELFKLNLQELKEVHKQLLMVEINDAKSAKNYDTKAFWRKGVQNLQNN